MERNTQRTGLINLLALLAVGVGGFVVARMGNSLAGQLSMAFIGIGALVSAVSWFQMRLEERERLEKLEFDELAKAKRSAALFESKDAEGFPAQRSREQFERFFVPLFTTLLFLGELAGVYFLWHWLNGSSAVTVGTQSGIALALFGLFALVLFLLGKFSATIARLEDHRLLRPGASWLLLNAFLCAVVAGSLAFVKGGVPRVDALVARVFVGLLALLAFETLVNLVLELYRPRVKGKIARPLYESRVVGLLAHPEGVFTTAAQTLDYQFGFKVSETWAFNMVRERLLGFVLGLVVAAVLSSCVVFLGPGEQALLERFGRPLTGTAPLGPGAHFKLPWPIDRVYRFNVGEVKSFNVGFVPDPNKVDDTTILWTVPHYKEEFNFLVARRDQSSVTETNETGNSQSVPVNLLDAGIPVQFRIADVRAWAYGQADSQTFLEQVATREVVRYLASVDLLDIMSIGRAQASEDLRKSIQARADELHLGVEILFVGLQDIHPPTSVAAEFEAVNGAAQDVQAKVLSAEGKTNRIVLLAHADGTARIRAAEGAAVRSTTNAAAQGARFANQLAAYRVAPEIYTNRLHLLTVGRALAGTRKYIIGPTNTHNVFQVDLLDKLQPDLLDVNVDANKK
jgi:regulator of protease activity HflC (stomatin/prohibitin superfamily)